MDRPKRVSKAFTLLKIQKIKSIGSLAWNDQIKTRAVSGRQLAVSHQRAVMNMKGRTRYFEPLGLSSNGPKKGSTNITRTRIQGQPAATIATTDRDRHACFHRAEQQNASHFLVSLATQHGIHSSSRIKTELLAFPDGLPCVFAHRMVVEETPSSCSCSLTFLSATTSPVRITLAL